MADPLTVRRARPADREDWLDLWRQWQVHMGGLVPDGVSRRAWDMAVDPHSGLDIFLVRDAAGAALGFATVSSTPFAWTASPIFYLQDLFVKQGARGKGAGKALLEFIYAEADAAGAAQVFWMVDENDAGLRGFYSSLGVRSPYLRYMRKPWPW